MSCELPGHNECPVVGLANEINGLNLLLDGIGTRIQNSNDLDQVIALGKRAGDMQRQIKTLERRKNGISRCKGCPVV
ncbi:hypothetical protein IPM62_05615 [Candidatus Woesebacteria bacterium]|nr:MAG: hypothetical protein IPM62_05615 [Candidatus Woesebacteria bacterium]